MKNEIKHTAHSTYRCEYHIVFAPKYRRKDIYSDRTGLIFDKRSRFINGVRG